MAAEIAYSQSLTSQRVTSAALAVGEALRARWSYVFGNPIRGVQGAHLVRALFPAIDHHLTMKTDNRLATGACVGPRKGRVYKARNRAAQHGPTEAQRVATVLEIRFAHRGGMIVEQAAKKAQCH